MKTLIPGIHINTDAYELNTTIYPPLLTIESIKVKKSSFSTIVYLTGYLDKFNWDELSEVVGFTRVHFSGCDMDMFEAQIRLYHKFSSMTGTTAYCWYTR